MIVYVVQDGEGLCIGALLSVWDNVNDAIEAAATMCAELDNWREEMPFYRNEYQDIRKDGIFVVSDSFGYCSITQMYLGGH